MGLKAVPSDAPGGKSQDQREWDWNTEIRDACSDIAFLQEALMVDGLGETNRKFSECSIARLLGMVRGRLEDMVEERPYYPVPGE